MMEWSLPTAARDRYHALLEQFASRADVMPFLRGGIWRSFFTKYSESNLMHKKMLHVSRKVNALAASHRGREFRESREEAAALLLSGQCNDPYWHGVFGGLYSPHLRTAVWLALAQAETIADRLTHPETAYSESEKLDFDADGRDEVYFTSDRYAALVHPDDGGTISSIDFRAPKVTLINSLARRSESYHAKIRSLSTKRTEGVQTIHAPMRAKEEGLDRWLHYDRWPRNAFRLLVFGRDKRYDDYSTVRLDEDAALAGGLYRAAHIASNRIELISEAARDWSVKKSLSFVATSEGFDIVCDVSVLRKAPGRSSVNIGIETVINLLAPSAADRYFESGGQRFPLRWSSEAAGPDLGIVDEWQRARVTLQAPGARAFWVAPIETVSESEDGFERVYQGSQILALWPVELTSGAEWQCKLVLKAAGLTRR
jgi:alpha-amylase